MGSCCHSVANALEEDIKERILQYLESKMEIEMANLAAGVNNLHEGTIGSGAPTPSAQPAPNATAYVVTANNDALAELLTLPKSMNTCLEKIEGSGHARKQPNCQSNNISGTGSNGEAGKCKHCGRIHPKVSEKSAGHFLRMRTPRLCGSFAGRRRRDKANDNYSQDQ